MKPVSIRLQLSLMMSLLTLIIIAVLSTAAYIEFKESLLRNIDTTLTAMAQGIRAELDEEDTGERRETELRAITGSDTPDRHGRYRVWVEGRDEDLFFSDPPDDPLMQQLLRLPPEEQPEVGSLSLFNVASGTRLGAFRVIWMRYRIGLEVMNILVARSSAHVYHEVGEFLRLLLVLGGSATLLAVLLVRTIVSWGLRPVATAGRRLEQITHRSLGDEAKVMGEVPAELRPFKSALERMLLRLNKTLQQQERLTADVAHELRTPLAIMKSTLQALRMQPRKAAEYEEGVDDALLDVGRMEQLVGQLLTLARLDAADELPDPAEVRLDVLLKSLAEAFGDPAARQGATVTWTDGPARSVQGNETELRQLFSNLIDNALRHGPRTGRVRVTLDDGPGPQVTVCVHDEGGAIPPEKLPYVFDRLYRVDSSRSQTAGGTGLGLAIARRIVLRHHGTIAITSDPQAGTSVTVQLPRDERA
ncbi:MAG: HAMP domain-containing sensor histidine kinase [Sedimentisphaerales bacterium]|nr:HAMP domain-containing sensor histidine kinase [Sedimentisphaerales bacterium]HNY78635.1 HAMP domain-containing sensor histidine kinase [Sedimentisphaerales bacterium]HOC64299.1 HAMP domain-containing sensor histidine kinase [Sedimentisphaerales bacterium]HOH64617.1 HAMP domain-containing sensor histidine kinase [Sedimentisphaerales bacterium]HQA88291.1 HAMP domain-containing sensor histidine kinase [Sedimentisphaerales bacterium]